MSKQLKITALTIGYQKPLLSNIKIETSTNQFISIFGRNGKGKSTLLRTLSGMLPPLAGQFIFNGVDMLSLSEKEKSKLISIVSSTQSDIGGIKVKDFVAFGRYPYTNWLGINKKDDYTEIENAINLCKINELANRNYDELSDGEKQKVNIARAIAQNTPIIILDEPTAHLDLINKIEVLKLLKELVKNHAKTIIISTHQVEYALQLCNEIWLINKNQIEAYTPSELINNEKLKELFDANLVSFDKATKTFKLI